MIWTKQDFAGGAARVEPIDFRRYAARLRSRSSPFGEPQDKECPVYSWFITRVYHGHHFSGTSGFQSFWLSQYLSFGEVVVAVASFSSTPDSNCLQPGSV